MQRDDEPTTTHVPGDSPTRTFAPVSRSEFLATLTRGADRPPPADAAFRFGPGSVLAKRYRIVAPLGRGGMGEVYRADDLTLGQSVALKFLPEHVATNPAALDRFRKEVAAARQVAHPHVCRVFDIGEADGQVFLSMEFIPGDDLGGVLRRVGRLTSELAIDLARQVAAGLQAVHDEGLVHRDLKPANVMVDGKGRARLTDFGLAATAESIAGLDAYAGTPAYQAPEQLSGGSISERTDVYALGVLAYELLTGQRPFAATDRKELIRAQQTEKPAAPSTFDPSITPEVDRVVLKCLNPDPKDRPASAHEVWRTLPGDAALNAALAAGQTPSAEAVADAGGEGRLSRRTAVMLAAGTLALVVATGLMQFTTHQQGQEGDLQPAKLVARCQSLLNTSGHPDGVPFVAHDFNVESEQLDWRQAHDRGMDRRDPETTRRFSRATYWYRVSPTPILPFIPAREPPQVRPNNPAFGGVGSAVVVIDTQGWLLHLKRIPTLTRPDQPPPPDWPAWFRAAGFDITQFRPVEPTRVWTVPHDARFAWAGVFPERPGIPVTIEAATDRGELVAFARVAPWTPPETDTVSIDLDTRYGIWWTAIPTAMLVIGGWLAYRNVQAGTADVQGAVRLGVLVGLLHFAMYVVYVGKLDLPGQEYTTWYHTLARVLLNSVRIAVSYLALEPFVRRRWPRRLIGWRRLLDGRGGNPWVGRDVLIGVAVGALAAAGNQLFELLPGWLGRPPELPASNLGLVAQSFSLLLVVAMIAVDSSQIMLFLLFGLSRLLRTAWLWVPAVLAIITFGAFGFAPGLNTDILWWYSPLVAALALAVLLRYGLLALVVAWIFGLLLISYPILYGWGTWFWPASALAWAAVLAAGGYGLVVSVGGWRRLVRADTAG